jgi:hypothetical protein
MSREDLRDILCRVIERITNDEAPGAGCIFDDSPCDTCDATTKYAVNEEG